MHRLFLKKSIWLFWSNGFLRFLLFLVLMGDFSLSNAQCLPAASGLIYHDVNGDCRYDSTSETGIDGFRLMAISVNSLDTIFTTTNQNGFYDFCINNPMPARIYTLGVSGFFGRYQHWFMDTCNLLSTFSVGGGGPVLLPDIGIRINQFLPKEDYRVKITAQTGWETRQGFTEKYQLRFENWGNIRTQSATLRLKYPNNVNFISASSTPNTNTNSELTWNEFLQPGEVKIIDLEFQNPLSIPLGSQVCYNAFIHTVTSVTDSSNLCQTLVAAIDPNDKQVFPSGNITPQTSRLYYQIRFQNTGTASAVNVKVVDTIDRHLPSSKIVIQAVSHPFTIDVQNNVLTWNFNNINLPDSNTNEPASHGFINYYADLRQSLAIGDSITNRADIYFDFQNAIKTNQTVSKVVAAIVDPPPPEDKIFVFPNPVSDVLTINYSGKKSVHFEMVNSLGQQVKSVQLQNEQTFYLDVKDLKSGLYILKNEENNLLQKVLILH